MNPHVARTLVVYALVVVATTVNAADSPATRSGGSVLVMNNGRVISGRVSQSAGGYLVATQSGSVLVPFEQVRLEASDLHDAYRRLKSSVPNPSAATHIALARWCLTQQLYPETQAELRSALEIEPDRAEARSMLRRLEELLHPAGAAHRETKRAAPQTDDGFAVPPSTSLGGLSRESARQFVTQVQPLLMNNCATARCHGLQAKNRFRLSPVRIGRGGSRLLSQRNLAAVLSRIDGNDPRGSKLLEVPQGNHGRGGRPIFSGPRGSDQFDLLQGWVIQVAEESTSTAGRSDEIAEDGGRSSNEPRLTLFPQSPASGGTGQPSGRDDSPKSSQTNAALLRDPLLEAILREERPDAFDPAEFNRQTSPAAANRE